MGMLSGTRCFLPFSCAILLAFGGSSLAPATDAAEAAAPPRPWQPEDFAAIHAVGDPQLSPDGEKIVYTVETIVLDKDKRYTHLWLARWDGSENRALTSGETSETHPRISPDGKSLAFLSSRTDDNKDAQLWLLPLGGGEAEKMTDLKGGVDDFAWSPDSARLALVVHDPDPRDPEGHEKDKKTVPPIVIDRYQFKQDIDGYLTGQHAHLRLLDLASRKVAALTSGAYDELLPSWSPDGREIAFVTRRGEDPDRTENWDIYVMAAEPGAAERQLTTSPEADASPTAECAPAWSPDGKQIAYLHGGDPKKIEYAVTSLAVIPAAGGSARVLTPRFDRNVIQPRWAADGKSVLFLYENDRAQALARVFTEVDLPEPETLLGGRRKISAYNIGPGGKSGRTVVLAATTDRPYEVYAAEAGGALRDLSKQNDALFTQMRVARTEETAFKSADGTEVHGFLVHPASEPAEGGKVPTLLRPHGGPCSQYACEFSFEAQLFAAHGYAVVLPNPRGSTGRGEKYALGIYAAWGSVDVQDDLAAVDDAVARGVADPERLGVGGWSYGGMSTNYLIASTTRFKAATSGASIGNILAGYGTDEYIRDYEAELGSPWKNLDGWLKISYPFYHADKIKTPTLFMCGENDFNVPLINSEQMYQALRTQGVPTRLVIYPGQFHGFKMPSYIADRGRRYLEWYSKWLDPVPATAAATAAAGGK